MGLPGLGRSIAHASLVVIGWAGLAAIVASAFVLDADTPYPGLAALLPTLGSAALILRGTRRFSPGHVLVLAPMRWLGRISFSLYLVHWPILILPAALLPPGQTLTLASSLALAGVSIAVAAGPPLRHRGAVPPRRPLPAPDGPHPGGGRRLDRLAGAADRRPGDRGVRVARRGQLVAHQRVGRVGRARTPPARPRPTTRPWPPSRASPARVRSTRTEPTVTSAPPTGGPTPSTAPTTAPPTPTPKPVVALKAPKGPVPLPANVKPSLATASNDWERLLHDGCLIQELQVVPPNCVYGDPNGTITVALVGDSHASQWFPALERIALAKHWKLVPFVKLSCRFVDLPIYSRVLKREYTECEAWRPLVIKRLQALKPDLTIVAAADGHGADDPRRQLAGRPGHGDGPPAEADPRPEGDHRGHAGARVRRAGLPLRPHP